VDRKSAGEGMSNVQGRGFRVQGSGFRKKEVGRLGG
jgi:hypothetical protein